MHDYWVECIAEAFEDAKIEATDEQIATVVSWVGGAHENYGMAHGHDCIPNHQRLEADRLRKDLKIERSKVVCPECRGSGRIISHGPSHSTDSECYVCHGEGSRSP